MSYVNILTQKKFDFGKIDWKGNHRKAYPADVTLHLREVVDNAGDSYLELSICGYIWNTRHTDCVSGGQNLDEMNIFLRYNPVFSRLFRLWKGWHLNGMNAGTPDQEAAVAEWKAAGNRYDYRSACEMLKGKGLYTVNYTGRASGRMYHNEPYTYGTGWCVRELPAEVLAEIESLTGYEIPAKYKPRNPEIAA